MYRTDGWMRFWFRGELVPLTAELQASLITALREAAEAKRQAEKAIQEAKTEREARLALEAEVQRLRTLLQQRGGELSP